MMLMARGGLREVIGERLGRFVDTSVLLERVVCFSLYHLLLWFRLTRCSDTKEEIDSDAGDRDNAVVERKKSSLCSARVIKLDSECQRSLIGRRDDLEE